MAQTCLFLLSMVCIYSSFFEQPGVWGCGLVYLCMAVCLGSVVRFTSKPTGVLTLAYVFLVLAVSNRYAMGTIPWLYSSETLKYGSGGFLTVAYLVCLLFLVRVKQSDEPTIRKQTFLALFTSGLLIFGVSVFIFSFFVFAEPARRYWDSFPASLLVCAVSSLIVLASLSTATKARPQPQVKLRVALLICTLAAGLLEYFGRARWDLYVVSSLASVSAYFLFEMDWAKSELKLSTKSVSALG